MSVTKQQVSALYIAVYGRAPEASGLKFWSEEFTGSYADAAAAFVTHPLFAQEYAELSNQEIVEKFYTNILGAEGDTAGIEYWVERLENGEDMNVVLSEFLNISLTGDFTGDEAALARQATLVNKAEVAVYYAEKMGEASEFPEGTDLNSVDVANADAFKKAAEAIANVTAAAASVDAAKAAIDAAAPVDPEEIGDTYYLEAGRDVLTGTDKADTFVADIIQNDNGQQVNTLGSGDRLDGGAGNDTLQAEVAGNTHVSGGNQQIQPKTTSVENIELQAVASNVGTMLDGIVFGTAVVNAKDMNGVNYIGSERSNTDLLINDLTTKDNNGNARNTNDMTIGMKYTSNSNSQWEESNLTVLFDQDYLVREDNTLTKAFFWLEDRQGAKADPTKPIARIDSNGVRFNLDGVEKQIVISDADFKEFMNGGEGAGTWEGYVALLEKALVEAQKTDASLKGLSWSIDTSKMQTHGLDGTLLPVPAPAMVLSSNNNQIVEAIGFHKDEKATGNYDVFGEVGSSANTEFERVAINVELEKVGLTGDGGELVIGSNNKGSDSNTWNPSDVNNVGVGTVTGIEEFNITVNGGKDKSSSLAGLRSTNNQLQVVTVKSEKDGDANLVIGNSNTDPAESALATAANALKDVKIFDASQFNGDLTLTAALTSEIKDKYLADGGQDGSFVYTGGAGNDTLNILLSSDNLAAAGTATHGDFEFLVDGGKGNDTITVGLYDANGQLDTTAGAWYANQKLNANLAVNAGEGNDTVSIQGSGDWTVDLGAGNDVIYVNNSGNANNNADASSVWVFNAASGTVGANDIVGNGDATYTFNANTHSINVKVDFLGFETTVGVALNGNKITQKDINNAIKNAIANDDVLNKLLKASAGENADTLTIESLIDGVRTVGDLKVSISVTDPKTGGTPAIDDNAVVTTVNGKLVDPVGGLFKPAEDGDVSTGVLEITGGAGDDVLVLSTGANQEHVLVYKGYDNGTDTIVNFTSATANGDKLDLSSYKATGGLYQVADQTTAQIKTAVEGLANGKYVFFNEDAANNAGEYTVTVWEKTAAGVTELGKVGVLDFGDNGMTFDAAINVTL